jgi:transaldolase
MLLFSREQYLAVADQIYAAGRALQAFPRSLRAQNAGVRPQRLRWASTGTKDPAASDILYVKALPAPYAVNTMPEATLKAFADHGSLGLPLPGDVRLADEVIARHTRAGIDVNALAAQLQDEGAKAFVNSWNGLLARLARKAGAQNH